MIIYDNWKVKDEVSISETFIPKNQPKFELKWVKNGHFYANFIIGVSADLAEYSVPNIRRVLAEYSAEYSVFGRTLLNNHYNKLILVKQIFEIIKSF